MWKICVDFKVLNMLTGQQSGFTKYPCFLSEWDSRDRINHWIKCDWPLKKSLTPGYKNISHSALVDGSNKCDTSTTTYYAGFYKIICKISQ